MNLDDLRGPECLWCGASLEGKRADAIYCSNKCAMDDYHRLEKEARLEAKQGRICVVCNGAISPHKRGNVTRYCSIECQRVANYNKACGRYPKTCEHCGTGFNAHNRKQRYCSVWCRAQGDIRKMHPKPCERCGSLFQPKREAAKYCGSRCAALDRESKFEKTTKPCAHCGTPFTGQSRRIYCGTGCLQAAYRRRIRDAVSVTPTVTPTQNQQGGRNRFMRN